MPNLPQPATRRHQAEQFLLGRVSGVYDCAAIEKMARNRLQLLVRPMATTKLKRPIVSYLKENVHYTFSGMNFPPTFLDLFLELGGVDRVMFSADYPYQSMAEARAFLARSQRAPPTRNASRIPMQNDY